MPYDEQLADRTREIIARTETDVQEKKMFGGVCFMVNGKMCCGVSKDRLMVRFDPAINDQIMEMNGVGPMDFTTRVMTGFAFVETDAVKTAKELEYWVGLALEFNKKAKPSKKRLKRSISQ